MKSYIPNRRMFDGKKVNVPSAWVGLETILQDILERFEIQRNFAIDFGVDYGYSTAIFANYFKEVWGVDNFKGENQVKDPEETYKSVTDTLKNFSNITLVKADYKEFINTHLDIKPDLCHIDMWHNFDTTYEAGLWAAKRASIVLFHDTTSSHGPNVVPAIEAISEELNKEFYNFPDCHGLGIVV